METDARRERVLLVLSFAAIHIVWGSTYLAIRYAIETIPPLLAAGLRHTIGGGALFAWCWWHGHRPTLRQWRASIVLGVLFFLIGHGSLHWAELYVASGVAALLVSTEPIWVAVLQAFTSGESRVGGRAIAGMIMGMAGVAILVGVPASQRSTREMIGSLVIIFGALSWSIGMIYSRRAALHPVPLMSSAMSLVCGGVMLLTAAGLIGGFTAIPSISTRSLLALTYLIVLGSLTFAGYYWLLTRTSPVLIATHTYTNPLIAVMMGALIAGESLPPRVIFAAAFILSAILLVKSSRGATVSSPASIGKKVQAIYNRS